MSTYPEDSIWLPTPKAAKALGVHHVTLKKYARVHQILEPEKHFVRGPFPTSPIRWNVPACREALHRLGMRVAPTDAPEPLKRHIAAKKAAGRGE